MTTHLGIMIFFAACVSAVFAAIARDAPGDQLRFGSRMFTGLVLGAYGLGWVLFGIFR